MYKIKDTGLYHPGNQKLNWVKEHMPVLNEIRREFEKEKPFKNEVVAICLHLEAKTGYMAEIFQCGGAEVYISGSNPLSTDDEVCAALVKKGIKVYSWHGIDEKSYEENLKTLADAHPKVVIDDGGDLTTLLHTEKRDVPVKGACEETTTGIVRVRALERGGLLRFPVLAVNNAYCKHLFDNRYGTGQSVLDGIMRTTNLVLAGKNMVVAGYGWCGKGIAMRARGMGAKVIITEIDPVKALEALMEGFSVMPMDEACEIGDFFVTCTGNTEVITKPHFKKMKNGAILCNAGHFNVEIDVKSLRETCEPETIRKNVEEYHLNGKKLYLLGEGNLVNLACADGHPAEIMDLSFALQVLSAHYVLTTELQPHLMPVPEEVDRKVAGLALKALTIKIDQLTEKQKEYLTSWELT